MTDLDLSWAAGFFDGEGCVYIQHHQGLTGHQDHFELALEISSISLTALEKFQSVFALGKIRILHEAGHKENWRRAYRYRLSSVKASNVLKALLPYLTTKKLEALVASDSLLAWGYSSRFTGLPTEITEHRREASVRLKQLKREVS